MEKIVLYGMGANFLDYKDYFSKKYTIVGVSDSNDEKSVLCDNFVRCKEIKNLQFDYIIVTASRFYEEIKNNLVENCNIQSKQIISLKQIMEAEKDVIVIRMYGGMGNYLFQYALYKKLQFLYPTVSAKVDL